jgi:hypothetical protein
VLITGGVRHDAGRRRRAAGLRRRHAGFRRHGRRHCNCNPRSRPGGRRIKQKPRSQNQPPASSWVKSVRRPPAPQRSLNSLVDEMTAASANQFSPPHCLVISFVTGARRRVCRSRHKLTPALTLQSTSNVSRELRRNRRLADLKDTDEIVGSRRCRSLR